MFKVSFDQNQDSAIEMTSITPTMDRENIKRMGHSLIAFSRLRSLLKMSKQQLADMPKEVVISCAAHEISLVWDKLPKHLQEDIDILKYQYSADDNASSENNTSVSDVNDGPAERKVFCCYCKVRDVNIASSNEVIGIPSSPFDAPSPPKRRRLDLNCCNQQ